ncbi:MAG: hypothetical protein Kow00106_01630 [Anaerolineae bacterium]
MTDRPSEQTLPPSGDEAEPMSPEAGNPPADDLRRDEPPLAEEDTRPRVPLSVPRADEEPPIDPLADTAEIAVGRTAARPLLLALVLGATLCLCLLMVGFAGFAGYRDGLATNDARLTQTIATGIAEQYRMGVNDLAQGYAELAAARFAWIVETVNAPAAYAGDSPALLATARAIASYTPTPAPTDTLAPSATPSPSATPTVPSPTPSPEASQNPAYLFEQAQTALRLVRYEEAIEWLDALRALAPDYRAAEVEDMLVKALTEQGKLYLRGQNPDGADMLARGVLLIYRANEIRPVQPSTLLGEAIFVEMYLNARNYVNGGYYDQALPILEELCAMNCGWSYRGVSVQSLLDQARGGDQ